MLRVFTFRTTGTIGLAGALLLSSAIVAPAIGEIEVVVVTAQKRTESIQNVPVAISAFTDQLRDQIGIDSIQDMTNFTPGLEYNTSTDRITLRGVGRQTNVLSADAAVANYDDGVYQTFAVAAGRSSLELERVEILRGPQGTLYGRNSIAGAINEVTRRPTEDFEAEVRADYSNYDHTTLEGAISGPLGDGWLGRFYGSWDDQTQGWTKNVIPGAPSIGNVVNELYFDGQIQKTWGKLEMWTKIEDSYWNNGAGGPGASSSGWDKYDSPTYEYSIAATGLNPGYGCTVAGPYATANTTATSATSPLPLSTACLSPAFKSPWKIAELLTYRVQLPASYTLDSQWTYHADDFDVKYILGGIYYHYILTGPASGGSGVINGAQAPISSFNVGYFPPLSGLSSLKVDGEEAFRYVEENGFFSNEINLISTTNGPLQWQAGVYQFQQHYDQPVDTEQPNQPQWNNVFAGTCPFTGTCPPETGFHRYYDRPQFNDTSLAGYGQIDWNFAEQWKVTGGLRYSYDRKFGSEAVRLLCFGPTACFTNPEFNSFIPGGLPAVDLTQIPSVISTSNPPPPGVTAPTTYNANTGEAFRRYDATWHALTGTLGLRWQPDDSTMAYINYARGYKDGGFYVGIVTIEAPHPLARPEFVDSFEGGIKKMIGDTFIGNLAIYHYGYHELQIPVLTPGTQGGIVQSVYNFYNVPQSVSQGIELETTWLPFKGMTILANYSYDDAHVTKGQLVDPADPNGLAPGATPLYTPAQCAAAYGTTNICAPDVYTLTGSGNGWAIPQNLSGNRLPNAARHKIALNAVYEWQTDYGTFEPSLSYVWRSAQYGALFTRDYNKAPAWDQVDARLTFTSPDGHYEVLLWGKNITNNIGYDAGAVGTRLAGSIDTAAGVVNFVQGLNGPAGYGPVRGENARGIVTGYSVVPPATYGIELRYKF